MSRYTRDLVYIFLHGQGAYFLGFLMGSWVS